MAWQNVVDHLVTTLGTVALAPGNKIRRVYQDPPAVVQDAPCIVFYGSSGRTEWVMGGSDHPEDIYTMIFRVYILDVDGEQAAFQLRAWHQKVLDALRADGGLGGYGAIFGLEWDRVADYPIGGKAFVGHEYRLTIVVTPLT